MVIKYFLVFLPMLNSLKLNKNSDKLIIIYPEKIKLFDSSLALIILNLGNG